MRERELLHAALHVKARAKHPAYPQRCAVPDDKVSWRVRWPEYAPVAFTHAAVHANNRLIKPGGWADPPDCALLRREWRPNPNPIPNSDPNPNHNPNPNSNPNPNLGASGARA